MGEPGRVIVLGSVNSDMVVRLPRLPRAGETVLGGTFEQHWGGKGANQAVAARRFGADVSFVGCVGDDDLGREAVADLNKEGIDTRFVRILSGATTGVASILVDEQGENLIGVASGANSFVTADGIRELLRVADGTRGVVLASLEVPIAAVAEAAAWAAEAGWLFILNPAPVQPLPASLHELPLVVTPNEGELERMAPGSVTPAHAARALSSARWTVVATIGADGALLARSGEVSSIAAPSVRVVDTTGAGDTFNGVLAASLAAGESLTEAAELAVHAASLSVEAPGARGGMPDRKFMKVSGPRSASVTGQSRTDVRMVRPTEGRPTSGGH